MSFFSAEEIQRAQEALRQHGSKTRAAAAIGITRSSFLRRIEAGKKQAIVREVTSRFTDAPPPRPAPLYSPDPPVSPPSHQTIRVLAIGDSHDDPYLPKDRFRWIGKFAAEICPDRIVQIGDIADFESLGTHAGNETESGRYKPRFMADLASLDQALEQLFEPMTQANVKARTDLTLGNHEHRIWRFEDRQPEISGMLQADFTARLAKYGISWHAYGQYLDIGGVSFTHAPHSIMGKPIGGMTSNQTIARHASGDIVYGHTHRPSVTTTPRLGGGGSKVTIIDLGCSLPQGYVARYAKHNLTGWGHGVWCLLIRHGGIIGFEFTPMSEMERRFG